MRHVPCFSRVVSVQSNQSWPQSTWHVAPRRAQAGWFDSKRSLSAEAWRETTAWSCLTAAALGAGDAMFGCDALLGAFGAFAGVGAASSDALSGRFSQRITSSKPSLTSNWWNSSLPQGSAKVKSAVPGPVASQLRTVRFAQVLPRRTSTRSPRLKRTSDLWLFGAGAAAVGGAASTAKPPSRDADRSRFTLTKVSTVLST
mmetsp:Transcript_20649/g.58427  ORF Transcript_20649/g.58427 Transcript_20649/m.58427 type:complete len:201 (+) Transcript_20649:1109-1711(+)